VHHVADSLAHAHSLRKEWKEVKVNAKDNPLGISVYKLAAKDGKGTWFARRSVHEGVGFERWRLGLEREFAETMKVKGGAGSGSIRGIGAERRVEEDEVDGSGQLERRFTFLFPFPCAAAACYERSCLANNGARGSVPIVGPVPWSDYPERFCCTCTHFRVGNGPYCWNQAAEVVYSCL
jgi:hypothetical protein